MLAGRVAGTGNAQAEGIAALAIGKENLGVDRASQRRVVRQKKDDLIQPCGSFAAAGVHRARFAAAHDHPHRGGILVSRTSPCRVRQEVLPQTGAIQVNAHARACRTCRVWPKPAARKSVQFECPAI